ncbi:hypothetical protein C5167_007538 [Papaver somniferum]|nr:hypothetical protein C5167_007538 [Papaver somniferum]
MGTVSGQAPGNFSATRASPDGGCAVDHGGIVRLDARRTSCLTIFHKETRVNRSPFVKWKPMEKPINFVLENLLRFSSMQSDLPFGTVLYCANNGSRTKLSSLFSVMCLWEGTNAYLHDAEKFK